MKTCFLMPALIFLVSLPSLNGCVERTVYVRQPPPPGPEVVVTEAPPAPQTEVIVAAPGPGYIWVPGFWSWNGRWVWVAGRWGIPPHGRAVWVRGRWAHRGHGYVWIEGRWR